MPSLKAHFDILKSRIEPSPDRKKTAQDMPGKVRDYLKDHEEFVTEEPHTRLAGSYARSTATKSIKDIDILVFCDQAWRSEPIADLLNALRDAFADLPNALEDCGDVTVRKQRRSINIELEKHELSLDVVPVLLTTSKTADQLEVPDREWDDWVYTHPLGYACHLSELNGDNGGKIVPMVKLWKHWRDEHFQRNKPKSYWLESLIAQYVRRGIVTTDGKGDGLLFADLCEAVHDRFKIIQDRDEEETPFIPDGALRNHVAWNWRREAFETFMRRVKDAKDWSRAAVDTEDANEAIRLWKLVFGDTWFPSASEVEKECKALGQACEAGALFVAKSGLVLSQPITGAIKALPTRFFGDA